ncbi:multisubunit sodium/proton antiporter, MrpG subunit (TC 2.A.63.1) [Bhargavaea ginsengi]|uniref:Multisubunit sodium/proton antiporter, MrpG subunit (TC 2.A.63.1) n=1 Tax=Bhargavaea ginsengi TaxID=426757 RepID=A0A1H7CAP2_9BACL|nr:monovalent cation/H(+) antiporter subunit G [Bhargavaea ginsengi]MCM3087693.1 monovalent cation/H(+) antiporter subunit G [Bhargavaea ginsengi]SEJ83690.1 multisubunit sodium/proton antiporter, MrpG subunit (TC 2.A.63.1) [Bhargavaea ginsengi]
MEILINILVALPMVVGVIFTLVTAIGLLRFPDPYTRAHAASKSSTVGVLGILLSVFLHFWLVEEHFNPRILLGILFLFITAPVGGHMMSRAAYFAGVKPSELTVKDELGEDIRRIKEK